MNRLRSISGDCSRLGYVPTFRHADCLTAGNTIAGAVICHGTFGSGDKIQTTEDYQSGASDDAQSVAAKGSVVGTGEGTVSNRSILAQQNAVALGGNSQMGGARIGGSNTGTVTVGYDGPTFSNALSAVGSNLTNAVNAQSAAGKSTLDAVLNQLTGLAESKQTDGESGKNKIVLYIALGALALVAWLSRK